LTIYVQFHYALINRLATALAAFGRINPLCGGLYAGHVTTGRMN